MKATIFVSCHVKFLVAAIAVVQFRTNIYTAGQTSPTTATRSPAGTTRTITNGIKGTDPTTSNKELNDTATTRPPMVLITPLEINRTDAATSNEEFNITDVTRSPMVTTKPTPLEINITSDVDLNITTTTSSSTVTAKTSQEEVNSTDATTTDELNITSTNSKGVTDLTTQLDGSSRSEATSEPQNNMTTELLDDSSRPILYGVTLTGVIIASTLSGLTCLIVCVIVSIMIAFKMKQKIRRIWRQQRAEISATNFLAVYAQWNEAEMTRNPAYCTGKQVRAGVNAYYSSRPSSSRAVTGHNNLPNAMFPPKRYARLNDRHIDSSMDSQGYVKLPRPSVLPKRYNRQNDRHFDASMDSQGYVKLPRPLGLPKRYNRLNNQQIDASMDSQNYVKLPGPAFV